MTTYESAKVYYNGAFIILNEHDSAICSGICIDLIPAYRGYIEAIATDWLGNIYAKDHSRILEGEPTVMLFDANSLEVFDTKIYESKFLTRYLIEEPSDFLRLDQYAAYKDEHGERISPMRCASYIVPLRLGGSESVENLQDGDLEVNWQINMQIG